MCICTCILHYFMTMYMHTRPAVPQVQLLGPAMLDTCTHVPTCTYMYVHSHAQVQVSALLPAGGGICQYLL